MNIEIINTPFEMDLYGCSGTAVKGEYAKTGFVLMDKMWKTIRENGLKNKGINIWVYEGSDKLFTGVELEGSTGKNYLEPKNIRIQQYAYYKYIGPYNHLGEVYVKFVEELTRRGIKPGLPYLEIYGHYSADESKSETELLMCLE